MRSVPLYSIKWVLIYMHSEVSGTKKGALKIFREMYIKGSKERQDRCLHIHIVQPSNLVKFRMLMTKSCKKDAKDVFKKISQHKK